VRKPVPDEASEGVESETDQFGLEKLPDGLYRPDESKRLEQARRWIRVARGEE
jgi:hypothetical protein